MTDETNQAVAGAVTAAAPAADAPKPVPIPFDMQSFTDATELMRQRFRGKNLVTVIETGTQELQLATAGSPEQCLMMLSGTLTPLLGQLFQMHASQLGKAQIMAAAKASQGELIPNLMNWLEARFGMAQRPKDQQPETLQRNAGACEAYHDVIDFIAKSAQASAAADPPKDPPTDPPPPPAPPGEANGHAAP